MIKGYFDDSRTSDEVWAVAGYVGSDQHWGTFEEMWPTALANHDVPYFHMKEMADPNGVYKKWHPPQDHDAEKADFLGGLAKVIRYSKLEAFASIARVKDLQRFNLESGLKIEPYPLAVYGCMIILGIEHEDQPIELIFDHVEKVESKLAKARTYADSDSYYAGTFDKINLMPLARGLGFKDVVALQAADFSVWELRKNHLQLSEWFGIEGKPSENFDERWQHFEEWSIQRFGQRRPTMRKSIEALLASGPVTTMVWDYDQLCRAHRFRGGVWSAPSAQSA